MEGVKHLYTIQPCLANSTVHFKCSDGRIPVWQLAHTGPIYFTKGEIAKIHFVHKSVLYTYKL